MGQKCAKRCADQSERAAIEHNARSLLFRFVALVHQWDRISPHRETLDRDAELLQRLDFPADEGLARLRVLVDQIRDGHVVFIDRWTRGRPCTRSASSAARAGATGGMLSDPALRGTWRGACGWRKSATRPREARVFARTVSPATRAIHTAPAPPGSIPASARREG